ncbi:MAG: right-handed parallel beta-helix repeat-containing protein, partial [Sedimentisphaerales bacterium]|nr:right-handed parallel beta-helix repeat-containing protein [Sedimentisphaerales bacterium]
MKTITHPASKWLLATRNCTLLLGLILILTICTSVFAEDPNWWHYQDNWHSTYEDPNGNTIPATAFTTDWHDGNCWNSQNNGFGFGVRPPDANVWACIEPRPPGPYITGNAECSRLSIHPWSWDGAPNIQVNIAPAAGTISCGVCIGIGDIVDYNSATQGYGTLNVYGGTMTTPTAPEGLEGEISGLWVGGGLSKTGDCYGIVNMYGGQITVPRVAVYYGVINLYGGLLYNTGTDVNADFVISESRAMNKIIVCDDGNDQTPPGELRLKGNRTGQVNYYIQQGRICPCGGQNSLRVEYNSVPNYTSVKAAMPFYVDNSATGANNGSSWANAYKYLQNALWAAGSGAVIWVAQGTYRPDEDSNQPNGTDSRYASFWLKSGVAIYGGFPTGGGSWASRNPGIHKTILSGDIGSSSTFDNSYIVVTGSNTDSTAILDGFTITAGYNDLYAEPEYLGAGGGMFNRNGSPTVTNCTFIGNYGMWWGGGGMYNEMSSPTITDCAFLGNYSEMGGFGSAILNYMDCYPTLINCIFSGNQPDSFGTVNNYGVCSPTLINCTFSSNYSGGIYNYENSNPTLTNCIFWGNAGDQIHNEMGSSPIVSYCDVQYGWSGTGNIDADPLFVDADGPDNVVGTEDDNLRLKSGSPCIDAGDSNAVPGGVVTDLDGLPRFFDDTATADTGNGTPPIVDMGAYEYRPLIFVDANATGANNGTSWADAYEYLQDALSAAEPNYEIWIAQGTYRPDENSISPDGTGSRYATFQLKNNVAIYGGFPTGGGLWASRNPNLYKAILSGDIGVA